jgi:hypothetical protein
MKAGGGQGGAGASGGARWGGGEFLGGVGRGQRGVVGRLAADGWRRRGRRVRQGLAAGLTPAGGGMAGGGARGARWPKYNTAPLFASFAAAAIVWCL